MARRFRGFLPVAMDIETSGFDADRHGILEIAAVTFEFRNEELVIDQRLRWAVRPFAAAAIDQASLKVTGIDLDDQERGAVGEKDALTELFKRVRKEIKRHGCQRAIVLAHNAAFDAGFLRKAVERTGVKRDPFHPFSTLDTVSLAALSYGHTVLSETCRRARNPLRKGKGAQRPLRCGTLCAPVLQDRQHLECAGAKPGPTCSRMNHCGGR